MKLGVLTVPLQKLPAKDAFTYLQALGVETVELGTGGYTNDAHLTPASFLDQPDRLRTFQTLLDDSGLTISALSCHGNPVHPDKAIAAAHHQAFVDTCRLSQQLGVDTVVTFSGCPGDSEGARYPNWVTCSWPEDYTAILRWQWEEVLIPYWQKAAQIARDCGVKKIALELHPGFCCYNPATLKRLREAVGESIGANFDPSHLIWQGMDPVAALRELQGAIYHVHAKDTRMDRYNTARNGVLDTGHYGQVLERSWSFCTVGYGSDEKLWKDMMATLQMIGYDGAVSIEHEDGLMAAREGLEKAVAFMKRVMIRQQPGPIWWA